MMFRKRSYALSTADAEHHWFCHGNIEFSGYTPTFSHCLRSVVAFRSLKIDDASFGYCSPVGLKPEGCLGINGCLQVIYT